LLVERLEAEPAEEHEVYPADTNLGGVECHTATRDVSWRFAAATAGKYTVQIRDLFNSGQADPCRNYTLAIRKETPDFALVATPQSPPPPDKDRREAHVWTTLLRAGDTQPIKIVALRRDNFDDEIRVSAEDLPA